MASFLDSIVVSAPMGPQSDRVIYFFGENYLYPHGLTEEYLFSFLVILGVLKGVWRPVRVPNIEFSGASWSLRFDGRSTRPHGEGLPPTFRAYQPQNLPPAGRLLSPSEGGSAPSASPAGTAAERVCSGVPHPARADLSLGEAQGARQGLSGGWKADPYDAALDALDQLRVPDAVLRDLRGHAPPSEFVVTVRVMPPCAPGRCLSVFT